MKSKFFSMVLVVALLGFMGSGFAQEAQEVAVETPKVEPVKVKSWNIPPDLLKNLTDMINEFNARLQSTVDIYKAGLVATKAEFKEMPLDVILDLENGLFIDREDYERLVKEAQEKAVEPIKKDEKK